MNWLGQILGKFGQMFNWVFIVVPWQQGIRVRMGKTVTLLAPGVHFQVPFIDHVYIQNVRERVVTTTSQTLTMIDGETVTLCAALRFEIVDIRPMYQKLHQASQTICQIVEGYFSEYIIANRAEDCTPEKVLTFVKAKVDLSKYGLNLTSLFLTDFVRVRTFRLIQGEVNRYSRACIQTDNERRSGNDELNSSE